MGPYYMQNYVSSLWMSLNMYAYFYKPLYFMNWESVGQDRKQKTVI
jgi:hypothetical protein